MAFFRKALTTCMLALTMLSSHALTTNARCAPATTAEIKMGVVGNDAWAYWWCKNETDVWLMWNGWLEQEIKTLVLVTSSNRAATALPYIIAAQWSNVDLNTDPTKAHLKAAVATAAAADTSKPVAGPPPSSAGSVQEIWQVTTNGGSYFRKTSKVVNGVVQAYGTGSETVRVGRICDNNAVSFPIGNTTKYLPVVGGVAGEVVSCTRTQ